MRIRCRRGRRSICRWSMVSITPCNGSLVSPAQLRAENRAWEVGSWSPAYRIALSRSTAKPLTPSLWPPGEEFGRSRTARRHRATLATAIPETSTELDGRTRARLRCVRGFKCRTETGMGRTIAYPLTSLFGHGEAVYKTIMRESSSVDRP